MAPGTAGDDATSGAAAAVGKSSSLPPLFCSVGSETTSLTDDDLRRHLRDFLKSAGERDDVLIIPPDFTRFHSRAGKLTQMICEHYGFIQPDGGSKAATSTTAEDPSPLKKAKTKEASCSTKIEILPALGTHAPMTIDEILKMFGSELAKRHQDQRADGKEGLFLVHDWRSDVVTVGEVPSEMVHRATRGMISDRTWPAQLNKLIWEKRSRDPATQGRKPLVLSIGQVVPHEVMGMANFNKNLFVGTGGVEAINLSHFIGAVHGMEQMMGRKNNPLRDILNYASEKYLENELDLWYLLTVVSPNPSTGELCVRGLYIGRDIQCYSDACDLSMKVNFTLLDRPVKRMVAYLDPDEFHSTWLGNKSIYRTRMAMADDGELTILAPGVCRFGEDDQVDKLIRKYGYKGTPVTMKAMEDNEGLRDNLSAVAHLIHGSTEGRFKVKYCPGHLTREEIESVGFEYGDLQEYSKLYDVTKLKDGWHTDEEGEFFFISNPALGLWAVQSRF